MRTLTAFLVGSIFLTSCGVQNQVSTEAFCDKALNLIVEYKDVHGLQLLGGVFFANTTGFTIFNGLESEIEVLQNADPVKYYDLDSDSSVMKLCEITVE